MATATATATATTAITTAVLAERVRPGGPARGAAPPRAARPAPPAARRGLRRGTTVAVGGPGPPPRWPWPWRRGRRPAGSWWRRWACLAGPGRRGRAGRGPRAAWRWWPPHRRRVGHGGGRPGRRLRRGARPPGDRRARPATPAGWRPGPASGARCWCGSGPWAPDRRRPPGASPPSSWEGLGQGHGHLRARRVEVEASGRGRGRPGCAGPRCGCPTATGQVRLDAAGGPAPASGAVHWRRRWR